MTNWELILNITGEVSTTELSKKHRPQTLKDSKLIAKKGNGVAGTARENLEKNWTKMLLVPKTPKVYKQKRMLKRLKSKRQHPLCLIHPPLKPPNEFNPSSVRNAGRVRYEKQKPLENSGGFAFCLFDGFMILIFP